MICDCFIYMHSLRCIRGISATCVTDFILPAPPALVPRLEGLWCGAGRVEARTGSWMGRGTTSVIALELAPVEYFLPLILTSLVASPNEAQGITKQSAFV